MTTQDHPNDKITKYIILGVPPLAFYPPASQHKNASAVGLSAISFVPLRSTKGCRYYPSRAQQLQPNTHISENRLQNIKNPIDTCKFLIMFTEPYFFVKNYVYAIE